MTLSDVVVDESESVEAVVRWNPKLLPQLNDATIEVVATPVQPAGEPSIKESTPAPLTATLTATLTAVADAPERFSGRLPRLSPGAWNLQLRVTGGTISMRDTIQSEILVSRQASAELANVSCNRDLLKQLADLSGGELIEPFDTERLVSLVQPMNQTSQKIQERTLWDHWIVMLLFFTLLTSEWVIRKLNGLP
jgi:hypothetical protein